MKKDCAFKTDRTSGSNSFANCNGTSLSDSEMACEEVKSTVFVYVDDIDLSDITQTKASSFIPLSSSVSTGNVNDAGGFSMKAKQRKNSFKSQASFIALSSISPEPKLGSEDCLKNTDDNGVPKQQIKPVFLLDNVDNLS